MRHARATGKEKNNTARTLRTGRRVPLHGTRRGIVTKKGDVACLCECDAVELKGAYLRVSLRVREMKEARGKGIRGTSAAATGTCCCGRNRNSDVRVDVCFSSLSASKDKVGEA